MKTPNINSRLKSYFFNGFLGCVLIYISAGALFILLPLFFNWRISNYFKAKKTHFFIITVFIGFLLCLQLNYIENIKFMYGCFGRPQFSFGNNAFVLIVLSAMLWEILIYFREKKSLRYN